MKKFKYIIIGLLVFSFIGCKDQLNIEPHDRITGIWENESLIDSYITGLYNSMEYGFSFDMWGSFTDEMHSVHDDGCWEIQRGWLTADNIETTSHNSSPTFNKWGKAYENISDINEALQKIELSEIDNAVKQQKKGELKFIRAYLYSELICRYGDVPLITKVFELNDDFTDVSRASYSDVVDYIISELDETITLLPPTSECKKGRATPDAAQSLKSRVLLYAASPLNNPENDLSKWEKAAAAAKVIIDEKNYSLYDDYQNLFLQDNNEIIFARYFTASQSHNINGWSGTNSLYGGGANAPTQNLVMDYEMINGELPYTLDDNLNRIVNPTSGYDLSNPYDNRDPRFYSSILYDGCVFQGHEMEKFVGGIDSPESDVLGWNASMTGYNLNKFMDESKSVNERTDDKSTNPWIYFRYGEILLNYAEAEFELGEEDIAKLYINKIRTRAGMPSIDASGEELKEKIHHERRIELAFEGQRYFDVRRWKVLDKIFSKNLLAMKIIKNEDGTKSYRIYDLDERQFNNRLYRLPIPQTEIDKSEGALTQNSGY